MTDVKNNFYDSNRNGKVDGAALCEKADCYSNIAFQSKPFSYPGPSYLLSPQDTVNYVLSFAGMWYTRDSVDGRLINEARSYGGLGALISDESTVGGVGTVNSGSPSYDTDNDGIPDDWEIREGLDPKDGSDSMKIAENGYTHLENYLNEI
jgi:hypothetical protein